MAAKKPAREKSASKGRSPAPKKAAPAKAKPKAAKKAGPSEKKPRNDVRFMPFVPARPADRSTLDRINAMAARINGALVPVVRQLQEEVTTEQDLENVVRLLHQLFAANCGRFEAMLIMHRLSMSESAGFTDAEMKLLADQLANHFSDARCRVFDDSFQQYIENQGGEQGPPRAVSHTPVPGPASKRDEPVH